MNFKERNNLMYKLSDHIYILPYGEETDRPNIGYIQGSKESVLFDAGTGLKTVELLEKGMEKYQLSPFSKVIISHFHWDHSYASGYISGELIGSQYTADKMKQLKETEFKEIDDLIDEEKYFPLFCKEHLHMEYNSVSEIKLREIDTVTFRMTLDLGNVHVIIKEVTSPHCKGQLVGYVVEDKVLFVGDSFSAEIKGIDFIDNKELRKQYYKDIQEFDFEKIVLSHFDVMNKEDFWKEAYERLEK